MEFYFDRKIRSNREIISAVSERVKELSMMRKNRVQHQQPSVHPEHSEGSVEETD
jgi:hypothetical protein